MKTSKYLLPLLLCILTSPWSLHAQGLSAPMEQAVQACVALSEAIGSESNTQLKAACNDFKACHIENLTNLRLDTGSDQSLDGHFIFDECFVDSLIVNRQVRKFAQQYARNRTSRGADSKEGYVRLANKAIKGGTTVVWKTTSRNRVEFALVAEPLGAFTMNVKDKSGNRLYTETVGYKKGAAVRRIQLTLPDGKASTLFLEITNCGKRESSFALLKYGD